MKNSPTDRLISVVIITYNQGKYLKEAVESVLKQNINDRLELIVADDCSPDNTPSVVKKIINEHHRGHLVRYQRHAKNMGVMQNFIWALSHCTGSYIAVCEGDDYWEDPLKLKKQLNFLENNKKFVACYHNVKVVDKEGNILRRSKSSRLYNRDLSSKDLQQGFVMALSSIFFRNVLKEYPPEFYSVELGDKFLCSLLGQYGPAKYLSDIQPSAYRFHSNGIWSLKKELEKEKSYINSIYWMWKYYERIRENNTADHFFKLILKKGYLSSPFNKKGYTIMDKLEYLSLWILRRTFRILRYIFR